MTEDEYRKKKLAEMKRMADALEAISENVYKIWNEMPEPKSPFG